MKNNIFKKIGIFWICISLIFILPMNISLIFASSDNIKTSSAATNADVSTVCGGNFNVKDSLLMSVVTVCIPGILEKVNEWKNIKCETTVCYYDAVKNNLDPTFCMKQEAYRTCNYIVGDIFALPGFYILDYYKEKLANILANPIGTIASIATSAARAITSGSCKGPQAPYICDFVNVPYGVAANFLVIVDTMSLVQQLKDIFKNGIFPSLKTKSSCERLPEIKKEMDNILKYS